MTYNNRLKRPVLDRDFGLVKVFVFKNESYADLVKRCAYYTFPDAASDEESEFYLADASGHRIGGDSLVVVGRNGNETVPWSLPQYFNIRGTKYPSKVKFTIVHKMPPGNDEGIQ